MALKSGVTGYGTVPGSLGIITYPMTDEEKTL
jgi:hypothetical protein